MLLTGWKEIANYLRSSVRTVQRWEDEGLPVIRPSPNRARGHVIAYSEHLDRWLRQSRDSSVLLNYDREIKRTQELLLNLSKQRVEIRRRMDALRRELASLRAKHR